MCYISGTVWTIWFDEKDPLIHIRTHKVIRGESHLNTDLLNELVEKAKADIQTLEETLESVQQEHDEHLSSAKAEEQEYQQLKT